MTGQETSGVQSERPTSIRLNAEDREHINSIRSHIERRSGIKVRLTITELIRYALRFADQLNERTL